MIKKINLTNVAVILSAVILLTSIQLSYANGNSITVNVPNAQGGYTSLVFQKSGNGYLGPQGEYYSQFPKVSQLQVVYGLGTPASTTGYVASSTTVVTIEPPELPVYEQPDPPDVNYIWTPGYWAYSFSFGDYYWVPGTWVLAPYPGLLWTPGYWHWRDGFYVFSSGYWGVHIGFYGGINYGHGYGGRGFSGGSWHNRTFVNRTINETNITNITNNTTNNTSSFNGGPGGTQAKPTTEERLAMKDKHFPATGEQKKHMQAARKSPALRASMNHGKPSIAATSRPGVFKGKGIVAAKKAGVFYNKTKASAASHAHLKPKAKKPIVKKPIVKKPKPKIPPANGDSKNTQGSS